MPLGAHHFVIVRRRQQQQVCRPPHLDAVALAQVQGAGAVIGDQVKATLQVFVAEHVADVQAGLKNAQDVAVAQRVPRVDDGVLAKAHVHPGTVDLGNTGDATAFGVVVKAPLQVNALGRARHEVDARQLEQAEQLVAVGIVIRAHGHGMAGRHPGTHAAHPGLFGQHFKKT
ncbi:hypothetical protein D3C80_1518840 [compost metagenome]